MAPDEKERYLAFAAMLDELGIPEEQRDYVMSLSDENKLTLIQQMKAAQPQSTTLANSGDRNNKAKTHSSSSNVEYYITKLTKFKVRFKQKNLFLKLFKFFFWRRSTNSILFYFMSNILI